MRKPADALPIGLIALHPLMSMKSNDVRYSERHSQIQRESVVHRSGDHAPLDQRIAPMRVASIPLLAIIRKLKRIGSRGTNRAFVGAYPATSL